MDKLFEAALKKKLLLENNDIKKSEMIALGDQVMTDVWGAKRQNIDVILTEPIVQKDLIFTKINRQKRCCGTIYGH